MTVYAGDPVNASDINTIIDATLSRPLVRMVASGTIVLPDATATAIPFSGTDDIDTHGWHDPSTNNTRVTPTKAGYVLVRGFVFFAPETTPVHAESWIRKNGSTNLAPAGRGAGATTAFSEGTGMITFMNGSTDYVELVAVQDSAGADDTNQSSQYSSVLEVIYLRP
ncbi:hypothetical protein [Krasilnikovia sp. MM14-A1259]|uniref:hypothetical protein n=1 Tax=Krasilnikovia sp. MM14-A1259 TaxID=3373539 RepID=UPI00381D85A2